tara:strand:- start:82438 stop:84315 length:1878 start_codon:yes stop_codon:yes gene_type:complete
MPQNETDSILQEIEALKHANTIDSMYAQLQYDVAMKFFEKEDYKSAVTHAEIALKSTPIGSEQSFKIHNSLGSFYLNEDRYVKSLEAFKKAMQIAIDLGDPIKQGIVHYNLSTHYDYTKNRELSFEHLKKAYDLMIEAGDTTKTVYLLNAMATFDRQSGDYDKANERLTTALDLALQYGDSFLISTTYTNSANFYLSQKDTIHALKLLKMSYAIDKVSGNHANNTIVTYNIARIYNYIGQKDSAIYYYNVAKKHAENGHKLNHLEVINTQLFDLYYKQGKYDTLPVIFNNYKHVADSILSKENLQKYAEAQNAIELMTSQQELELIQINQQNNRQRLIIISLIVILLVIVLIGSVIARNNLQKQKDVSETLYRKTKLQKLKIEKQQDELIKTNLTLETNAKSKDRIMSLLAHDLRTPFSSIHSLNHLIRVTGDLTEKQLEFLETSNKVVIGGLDLISDILNIYKLEHLDQFELDTINISRLIENSIEKITPITTVKNQTISTELDDDLEFLTNREMIQSAIDNLLSNASKYSENGTEIKLWVSIEKDTLTIKIMDKGLGFTQEEKSSIFERFNKFTRSSISSEQSTGLGLFLVKGFVEKLNGTISVESEIGKGSTFTLVFKKIKE